MELEVYYKLYKSTVETKLADFVSTIRNPTFSNPYCQDKIVNLSNTIEKSYYSELAIKVINELKEYGDVFNTSVLDVDDIKIHIMIANFFIKKTHDDCTKLGLMILTLELIKDIIKCEVKKDTDVSFVMIDKIIQRLKSNDAKYNPKEISFNDVEKYFGKYGIYMIVKSTYYPYQSDNDDENEYYVSLRKIVELMQYLPVGSFENDIIIGYLEKYSKIAEKSSKIKKIETYFYEYGDSEMKQYLENKVGK